MIIEQMTYQFHCVHCEEVGNVHHNEQLARLDGEKHMRKHRH